MRSLLLDPFLEFDFLRRALCEAIVLSLSFAVPGLVLVTRRLSLIGDTMSHAMLPGVVVASLLAGPGFASLFVGGWLTGTALLVGALWVSRRRHWEGDAALALFAVFAVAVGVLIASRTRTNTEILHLLFGNVLAIDPILLAVSAFVGAVTWTVLLVGYRAYFVALVDPDYFRAVRPPRPLGSVFLVSLLAANLTTGFAGLGAMMTVGLLIVPALVGRRFGRSPLAMVAGASVFGVVVSYLGVLISYHVEVPSGPAIVVVACVGLALSLLIPRRSWS